jgi:hypothetical protein
LAGAALRAGVATFFAVAMRIPFDNGIYSLHGLSQMQRGLRSPYASTSVHGVFCQASTSSRSK